MVATPPFFDYTIANGFNRWRPIIDADLISKKKRFVDMLPTVETAGYG
jgi:hypothetical protein